MEHREGFIEDADYVKAAREIKLDLARINVKPPTSMIETGELLITIQSSWAKATKEQKRDMLRLMLEAVYVDTDEWEIVSVRPHPDFLPLFKQTDLIEKEGRFMSRERIEGADKSCTGL